MNYHDENRTRGHWLSKPPLSMGCGVVLPILILAVVLGFIPLVRFYTDFVWYDALGYAAVFWKRFWPQWLLFGFVFILSLGIVRFSLMRARKTALEAVVFFDSPLNLPRVKMIINAFALVVALALAFGAKDQWAMVLRFLNRMPFDVKDPIFNKDIGFYVFQYPFYRYAQSLLIKIFLVSLVGTAFLYFIARSQGSIDMDSYRQIPLSPRERLHLGVLGGILLLLLALGYRFDRYELLFSPLGVVFGAGYTDLHARLLAYNVLAIAVAVIGLFLPIAAKRKTWKFVGILIGVWIVGTVGLRGIYPGVIQRYVVEPNEFQKESPYIKHNILGTQLAYGLDDVVVSNITPKDRVTLQDFEENRETIENIRLWDYGPLLRSYKQLQEIRTYYEFPDIDIDRYYFHGEVPRQVMLAARELDVRQLQNPTWVNMHLEFTHGYGIVMNPVNEVTPTGLPVFYVQDLPPRATVPLSIEYPQIYYGEMTDYYVLVKTTVQEFDYPAGDVNVRSTYQGKGGVSISSLLRRLAFSVRFGDTQILFADAITPESRIMYYRNIYERVKRIAPFLLFDQDPYLTVMSGRLIWVIDAYTITDRYPYSQPTTLTKKTGKMRFNYIRNSVKVLVDAYDGSVEFYVSDPKDPLILVWDKIFPDLFKSQEEMPHDLVLHRRYPMDLFQVQAQIFAVYHMSDPNTFYNREDVWSFPTHEESQASPYYIVTKLKEAERAEYVLVTPYLPFGKNNMIAWLAGRCDRDTYGQLVAYVFPKQKLIYGPQQIEALINQHPEISAQLSLWSQRGSDVIFGRLLVIPLGDSILYVQPLYLRAENSDLPELKRIIVSAGGRVVWGERLDDAISDLFEVRERKESVVAESPSYVSEGLVEPDDSRELVILATEAYNEAQEALRRGDWAGYGEALKRLEEYLNRLNNLTNPMHENGDKDG